jgi:hypothetical protein
LFGLVFWYELFGCPRGGSRVHGSDERHGSRTGEFERREPGVQNKIPTVHVRFWSERWGLLVLVEKRREGMIRVEYGMKYQKDK